MNIIEEIVKKHKGEFSEAPEKGSNMTSGRYTFQPQSGIVKIGGTKISININAVGGAARTAEPYRIVLHLEKDYNTRLEVFPKAESKTNLGFDYLRKKTY
tara:strand:+ start:1315 stop:1614 length:300 start_codon:yes stop_codon:yes gene_type:complete